MSNHYSGTGTPWFEEDCEWALVAAAFPADFAPLLRETQTLPPGEAPVEVWKECLRALSPCTYGQARAWIEKQIEAATIPA